MVRYYNELTRLEMEQVDKDETVVMIPVGALEQHGNQCPLGTDEIIAEGTARRIKEALDRELREVQLVKRRCKRNRHLDRLQYGCECAEHGDQHEISDT